MPPIDLAFILQEDPKNQMNYIGAIFYDKFDGEVWKENLIKKLENIHRCKANIVKMFGTYWFKKMNDLEWDIKKHLAV